MTTTSTRPQPPRQAARSEGVFPALDGLRIVAVTAVVATHAAFLAGRYARGPGRDVLSHLDVGVAVFFVISGFLLSREWLVRERLPRVGAYAKRRALRILPMYWITVIIGVLVLQANRQRSPIEWLRQLLLVQIYGGGHFLDGLTQMWSLATEVSFYAVLPGLAWLIVRLAGRRDRVPATAALVGVLLCVASIAWNIWFRSDAADWLSTAGYWLPSTLGWFTAGTVLAAVRIGSDDRTAVGHRWWATLDRLGDSPGVCLLVALAAFAVSITPLTGSVADPFPSAASATFKNLLYLVVALGLVVPAVLGSGTPVDAVLGHPVLRWLGRVSYSVFLVHLMLLQGIRNLLPADLAGSFAVTFALTWAVSVAVAGLAYRLVERPALRLAHRGRR